MDLEEFDSTLYFLDESEINYVATEVEDEYKRDVRAAALNVLFDLVELEGDTTIRDEILDILESALPQSSQRARLPHRGRWSSGKRSCSTPARPACCRSRASASTASSPS